MYFYPVAVIPSKLWKHKTNGRTASIYGASPYSGKPGDMDSDWEIVQVGWTVRNEDGSVGCGKQPWKTKEEAQAYMTANRRET